MCVHSFGSFLYEDVTFSLSLFLSSVLSLDEKACYVQSTNVQLVQLWMPVDADTKELF